MAFEMASQPSFDPIMETTAAALRMSNPVTRKHPSYIALQASSNHPGMAMQHDEHFLNEEAQEYHESMVLSSLPPQNYPSCHVDGDVMASSNEYELLYHAPKHPHHPSSCAVEGERSAAFIPHSYDFTQSGARLIGHGGHQSDSSLFFTSSTSSTSYYNPLAPSSSSTLTSNSSSNQGFRTGYMDEALIVGQTGSSLGPNPMPNSSLAFPTSSMPAPQTHFQPTSLQHITHVMESIASLMCHTDVIVVTTTDSIRAHRAILASHSSYMRQLMIENDNDEPLLIAKDIDAGHFRLMMQFFYTGEVKLASQNDIQPLKEACSLLGVSSLMARLEELSFSLQFFPEAQNETDNANNCTNIINEAFDGQQTNCIAEPLPTAVTTGTSETVMTTTTSSHCSGNPTTTSASVSKMHQCSQCSSKFATQESLDAHLRIHKGLKPFECSVCGKGISSKEHLSIHMRVHTGVKPYKCSLCSKAFSDSSSLRRHMRTKHARASFECSECGKVYSDKSTLLRHRKEQGHHDNDMKHLERHVCRICDAHFVRRRTLLDHCRRVHQCPPPPETQLTINKDDEPKADDGHSENSLKGSTLKCMYCNRVFMKQCVLQMHLRSHTGDKPYVCELCGKQFARMSSLRLHERVHSGLKPHVCGLCDKAFSDGSALKRHKRTHDQTRTKTVRPCHDSEKRHE